MTLDPLLPSSFLIQIHAVAALVSLCIGDLSARGTKGHDASPYHRVDMGRPDGDRRGHLFWHSRDQDVGLVEL